jgi:hypothetical protein
VAPLAILQESSRLGFHTAHRNASPRYGNRAYMTAY